ncbi:hypothetical protein CSUI_005056 [Cystoisospora suis]|uniref:Uncharacterized protein n=1 Tax=Cystoisospora suis TaxID=483139 RepID=A0A2C6KKS7_9APIC|nr:hypothetical protein CSUI_005056 [Cystoisospora suis]
MFVTGLASGDRRKHDTSVRGESAPSLHAQSRGEGVGDAKQTESDILASITEYRVGDPLRSSETATVPADESRRWPLRCIEWIPDAANGPHKLGVPTESVLEAVKEPSWLTPSLSPASSCNEGPGWRAVWWSSLCRRPRDPCCAVALCSRIDPRSA